MGQYSERQIEGMNQEPGDEWLDISLSQAEQQLEEREERNEHEEQNLVDYIDDLYGRRAWIL